MFFKQPIDIGAQITALSQPIGRLKIEKYTYVKSRFICTEENFDSPSVFLVKLMAGASGGTRITTSTAAVAIRAVLLDEELNDAVQSPRVHHQLIPDVVVAEPRIDERLVEQLEERGHVVDVSSSAKAVVQARVLHSSARPRVRRTSDF